MPKSPVLPAPALRFEADALISVDYEDVYSSRAGSLEETNYVFLAGNGYPERWKQQSRTTIAELGFGTGLNFFAVWKDFLAHAPSAAQLHFISVELSPLLAEQITRALADYPELQPFVAQFVACLPERIAGIHHLQFDRVHLTLGYGDAAELLPQFHHRVDAWFLDGFSPAKNPAMWSEPVLQQVARMGGTFATFTAAGEVRRRLEAQGYRVEKRAGFGHKRDMLIGTPAQTTASTSLPPITVIGGGVAGCATARALAERGAHVTLYEAEAIAAKASGNPAALLYPRLSKHWSPEMSFYLSAYSYMLSHLAYWGVTHETIGMLKTIKNEQERERFTNINQRTGIDTSLFYFDEAAQGLRFPRGTWLDPRNLCTKLVQHAAIQVRHEACNQLPETGITILCNGAAAQQFAPECSMKENAGQISIIPKHHIAHDPEALHSHKGYVIPLTGATIIGATYARDDLSLAVTEANHVKNREEASDALPDLFADESIADWRGRTSIRATTPTRMPYIRMLREGLYINAGHGSRGMLSAPYGAALIADMIMG